MFVEDAKLQNASGTGRPPVEALSQMVSQLEEGKKSQKKVDLNSLIHKAVSKQSKKDNKPDLKSIMDKAIAKQKKPEKKSLVISGAEMDMGNASEEKSANQLSQEALEYSMMSTPSVEEKVSAPKSTPKK